MMSTRGRGTLGQKQDDGTVYLGVDGLVFDISNLSTADPKPHSRNTTLGASTTPPAERPNLKLYPSFGSIREKAPSIRDVGLFFTEMKSLKANGPPSDQDSPPAQVQRQFKKGLAPEYFCTDNRDSNPEQSHKPAQSSKTNPTQITTSSWLEKYPTPPGPRSNLSSIASHFSQVAAKPAAREIKPQEPDTAGQCASHSTDVNLKLPPTKCIEIEVSPGVFLPMRGAEETERAVRCGNTSQTTCACCETLLYCIKAAEFLYCPVCRVIGPVASFTRGSSDSVGGVGLGLTEEAMHAIMMKIKN